MNPLHTYEVLSPAKINLMLKILGQRKDGYHLLQSYFQLLNWGDTLRFKAIANDDIQINGNFNSLAIQDNLIYKALSLLKPLRKNTKGIHIEVDKKIPQGSGLGGGSSNAATTLLMMNDLWGCGLSNNELQKIALKLGADVPIFVLNHSAMAEGIGEILTPLQINKYYYVLIFPETSIATIEVFQDPQLIRNDNRLTDYTLINNPDNWTNSCLPVVLANYPKVRSIYNIASQLQPTYMSGTGSTLFCAFKNIQHAQNFIDRCPTEWKLHLCQSK